MQHIAIVTDSNSGITQKAAEELGVFVVPMPFTINGTNYFEDINLTQEEFYRHLDDPSVELSTSQPSPGDLIELWEKILSEYESLVYIPMSSGLSSSCGTAISLSSDFDGRVQVVDNRRISVTQRSSVLDAMTLAKAGESASTIKRILEEEAANSSIYIMVDSLKYLKKGGRITPAAALIGSVLSLKPVLQIQGDKLDAFAKCRGQKAAKATMIEAVQDDLHKRFEGYTKSGKMKICYSYSGTDMEPVNAWVEEIKAAFPGCEPHGDPLSLSVSCHIGPGALAITCQKEL